ncbi:sigma-54 interaction domain-containing protein [Desulforegula conservatrix]|uniref:sigma-54 interaction domain-containing protein n=1 Tax=Desulforegula conservatrix TaxID=153026 RepID=UPI0004106696|nr:sigma-54 dependent transcriptional regulator [Desulforegula conservatrix]
MINANPDLSPDLFREVTLRICGSLNIDEAVYDVFTYLKKQLPLDAILISVYEAGVKAARVIAMAYGDRGFLVDEYVPLSESAWKSIGKWEEESKIETIPWIRDHTHPINIEMVRLLQKGILVDRAIRGDEFCSITCALKIKKTIIGNLTLCAWGAEHYNTSHAELIKEINEPFAIALSNTLRYLDMERDKKALLKEVRQKAGDVMIGADAGLVEVRRLIEHVSPTDSPVILLGETGTGKEVVAAELHRLSRRSQGPFIRLNCGGIPESLIDSELFGHEKGAFTGAFERSAGRFERADGGTLFLDEIGELPQAAQVKLLRVLQSGEFERVGGGRLLKANVRIIAATHRNLQSMIHHGSFRSDLWYRLNVFPIKIPPLRERKQDIPAMIHHFIRTKSFEMNLPYRPELAPGELETLMSYDWPGNVRELQNLVERAIILSKGKPLKFGIGTRESAPECHSSASDNEKIMTCDEATAAHIRFVLKKCGWKISGQGGAAGTLGMNPSSLRSRMKKMGIGFRREI